MNGGYACRYFLAELDDGSFLPTKGKYCCERKREKEAKVMKEHCSSFNPNTVKKKKEVSRRNAVHFCLATSKPPPAQNSIVPVKMINALCPVNALSLSCSTVCINYNRSNKDHTEGDVLFAFGLATGFLKLGFLELKLFAKLLHNKIEAFL